MVDYLKPALPALLVCSSVCSPVYAQADSGRYLYHPALTGSDALYNPFQAFLSYALDPLQLPDNFDQEHLGENLDIVLDQLRHPSRAIEDEGGLKRFINREVFPVDADRLQESLAMVPNYALHLLGGGLAYRRDLEWFRAHDYPYPELIAAAWSMSAEILQEALEKKSTIATDPIADVYLFRPIGLLLFSSDRITRFVQRSLQPSIWPMLHAWDITDARFMNTGISYVYRPPALAFGDRQGFIYTGLTSLVGISQSLSSGGTLSLGIGASVRRIESQRNLKVDLQPSIGLFYDRSNSLQWSAVLNDTGDTLFRLNVYPLNRTFPGRAGWFLTLDEDGRFAAGLSIRLPFGLGAS